MGVTPKTRSTGGTLPLPPNPFTFMCLRASLDVLVLV